MQVNASNFQMLNDKKVTVSMLETPGVKTFKLRWPCLTELDPFLKKPKNNFLLVLLLNFGHRFEDPGFLY